MCEWSKKVHAAGTDDAFGKKVRESPHDAGLDEQCTL
jgi:hypothetical protein